MSWARFAASAPDLAADAHRLIFRTGEGSVLLATVRGDEVPRIHPISVAIVDGRLLAFILAGPKRVALETDGRYAMHSLLDLAAPDEVSVRGRATLVTDAGRPRGGDRRLAVRGGRLLRPLRLRRRDLPAGSQDRRRVAAALLVVARHARLMPLAPAVRLAG